ncbi:hypothetical protein [Actinoplanes sp. N902-109]|uniref:hypothetical protein n=1 Tax=Actinoplanes sp. (strain N902-109) TaxID=649831 RepID=UPI0003295F6F|nr:hypothetical protein [Actinoplanes sp. N902-109]AGL14275.1 hypothetical protein L083_0765 [Actinoplanes sp. N902-109]
MSRVLRSIIVLAAVAGLSFTAAKVADAAPTDAAPTGGSPATAVVAWQPPGGTCITCL